MLIVLVVTICAPLIQPSCARYNVNAPTPPLGTWIALPLIELVLDRGALNCAKSPNIERLTTLTPPATINAPTPVPASVPVVRFTTPPIESVLPTRLMFVAVMLGAVKYPATLPLAPTFKLPTIPAPPCTRNAPLVGNVDCVELLMYNAVVIVPPLNAIALALAVVMILPVPIQPSFAMYKYPAPTPPVTASAFAPIVAVLWLPEVTTLV